MSKHQVVEAYLRGQIGRREFIRRLTLAGVSSAAAVAYAQSLGSASAATAPGKHGLVASYQNYPVLDTDEDGLSDDEEEELGTDPYNPDSDGDGWGDGEEVDLGTDPLDDSDYPSTDEEDDGGTGGTTELPDTGVADSQRGTEWLAPLAAAGAGIAVIAQRVRRAANRRA